MGLLSKFSFFWISKMSQISGTATVKIHNNYESEYYTAFRRKRPIFFLLGIIFFSELLWENEWDSITLKSLMFTRPCHFWTILNLSVCRLQLQYLICSKMSLNLYSAHCLLISHSDRNIISKISLLLPKIQDSLTVCRSVFSTLWVETVILCSSLSDVEGK